jgi:hypothetical protein
MQLFLLPESGGKLTEAYFEAFENADEIFVLSAYLREWRDFALSSSCENVTVIVGKDFGITRKQALTRLLEWKVEQGDTCHAYVADGIDGFHPKILAWREGDEHYLIVGSSNLTVSAFESNVEANCRLKISRSRYDHICHWVADVLASSTPIDQQWIDAYQEKPLPTHKNRKKQAENPSNLLGVVLPRFPGLAGALAYRKERIHAFEACKEEVTRTIRACAHGDMSSYDFYEWLIENWNRSEWKFQGNGVFRHEHDATDWQFVCHALTTCLDAADEKRDAIVMQQYDRLEDNKEIARVRKAFLTEMLCHYFPEDYPLWNNVLERWFKHVGLNATRPRGLSAGQKYIWMAEHLRRVIEENPSYPANNIAELDHIFWALGNYEGWN